VALGKVVGREMLYNFGLYKFFPPPAVTMGRHNGCYNVHAKTYFNREYVGTLARFIKTIIESSKPCKSHFVCYELS